MPPSTNKGVIQMSFPIEAPPEEVIYLPERLEAGKHWAIGLFGDEGVEVQKEIKEVIRNLYALETFRHMAIEDLEPSFEDAPPKVIVGKVKAKFVAKPNQLPPAFDEE
jgi:hypothetical protein